jgi:hypothetical protein
MPFDRPTAAAKDFDIPLIGSIWTFTITTVIHCVIDNLQSTSSNNTTVTITMADNENDDDLVDYDEEEVRPSTHPNATTTTTKSSMDPLAGRLAWYCNSSHVRVS